jgi:catechol 2,3-dioxygenase-like lactoylglutathione lyase family enzyme
MALLVRGVAPLLFVYDMPTSVRFYRDMLGCEVVTTSPALGKDHFHWALLRLGGAELMLNTAFESSEDRPSKPAVAPTADYRDIWLYFSCPDIDGAFQELQSKGVEAEEPVVTNYGMKQMHLYDPDGYRLCFQWSAKA